MQFMIPVFQDVTLRRCDSTYRRFGEKFCLRLQSQAVRGYKSTTICGSAGNYSHKGTTSHPRKRELSEIVVWKEENPAFY